MPFGTDLFSLVNRHSNCQLFELLKVDDPIAHLVGGQAIKEAEYPSEDLSKLPLIVLFRDNHTGVLTASLIPCMSQWNKVPNVIGQDRHALFGSISQLGFIRYR